MRVFVLYNDKIIAETVLSQDKSKINKDQQQHALLQQRNYLPLKTTPMKKKLQKSGPPSKDHTCRKMIQHLVKLQLLKNKSVEQMPVKEIEKMFGGLVTFVH